MVWYSRLFKNFPVCCDPHSQRLGMANKAEVDVSLEPSCFFDDPADVGNLISGSSAFSKTSLNAECCSKYQIQANNVVQFSFF